MNNLIAIPILIFITFGNIQCHSLKKKVKNLEQENEQLKQELDECQNSPFIKLLDIVENKEYSEKPTYSRQEFHELVLPKIKAKSEEKYQKAMETIKKTEELITFCESIRNEMIERSGGLDTLNNRPKGCSDKDIGNKVLLEEGKGKIFKEKIESLSADFIKTLDGNPYYIERITLDDIITSIPLEKKDSWEEYKFKNLRLCVLLPIIGHISSNGIVSEIAVLQYLNE